jgi:Lysyl oxidase
VLGENVVRGALAAAAAVVVAMVVSVIPAQGTPGAVAAAGGVAGTDTSTPTTSSETPTTPTPTPTPTETTPTPTPTPTVTVPPPDTRLLPDLVAVPATELSIRLFKKTGIRRLRFTSSLGNVGAGPIEVRPNQSQPCPVGQHNSTQVIYRDANLNRIYEPLIDIGVSRHRAGCMIYHPLHHHWHFKASAQYVLYDPSAGLPAVVSARRKVSFCLRDTARLPLRYGFFTYPEAYGQCTRRSPQGISGGWMDIYQSFLAGQSVVLPPGLPDGLYCLTTVVDPNDQLLEVSNTNNGAVRALAIHGTKVRARPATRCL